MERSCAKKEEREFGIGMVHEGIITLRSLGLTAEGWEKMKDDKELAKKVVELIEGEKEIWLERIVARERACHLAFFDQEFDLTAFAQTLKKYGESKIRFWQKLEMEPVFLPEVAMPQDTNFRGWKVKPESWFWQKIAEGRILRQVGNKLVPIKEVRLEGITALIDTRLKPKYDAGKQMYENDNLLGPIIEDLRRAKKIAKYEYGPKSSRFGVSADEWETCSKPVLAQKLGLDESQIRLEREIEANVIPQIYLYMSRKDDGKTDTWEWREEYFGDRGGRLVGGLSGGGGLAHVSDSSSGDHWHSRSFRPLAVL